MSTHRRLPDGHPRNVVMSGVDIYFDKQMIQPIHSLLTGDKYFVDAHTVGKKNKKNANPLNFSGRYPFNELFNWVLGGWTSTFTNFVLCVNILIQKDTHHICLPWEDSTVV